MRLSEAIRLGSMATTQGFGALSIESDDAPCALGAARLAAGLSSRSCADGADALEAVKRRWPWLRERMAWPAMLWPLHREYCWGALPTASEIIWTLNDYHQWTREQIADWVETIEPREADASALDIEISAQLSAK